MLLVLNDLFVYLFIHDWLVGRPRGQSHENSLAREPSIDYLRRCQPEPRFFCLSQQPANYKVPRLNSVPCTKKKKEIAQIGEASFGVTTTAQARRLLPLQHPVRLVWRKSLRQSLGKRWWLPRRPWRQVSYWFPPLQTYIYNIP